jgi:hypothetical protein
MASESALTVSRPTIFVAHAPVSVMVLEGATIPLSLGRVMGIL